MSKQLEKYTPTIRKEKNIKIETNYKSTLDDIADKDGIIETKLNKESMIQAVSHKLYRNAESGFRELLNNEIRACQIARDEHKAKPYIKVSLSTMDRKLVIQGFNSQGITEEVFAKILREIGTSATESKKEGRIPFGMGFFGFLKLSDIAIVQTRCIANSDCYGFMAKGGLFFKKIQRPTFKETGTKISLTLKPKTNYEKIIKTLMEVSKVSGIKTYFELNAHKGRVAKFANGIHQLQQTTFKEMFDKTLDSDYSYLTSHVDNDDYEAYISIGIDNYESISNDRIKKFHLINSPIEAILDEDDYDDYDYESGKNTRLDDDEDDYDDDDEDEDDQDKRKISYKKGRIDQIYFHSFVINMKKEKLFVPHQDRERLTPEGEKRLRAVVIELYDKALKTIKPCHDLKSWFKHEHKYFISAEKNKIELKDTDEKTKILNKFLNEEYSTSFGKSETKPIKTLIKLYDEDRSDNISYNDKTRLFYTENKNSRIKRTFDENRLSNHFLCFVDKYEIERGLKNQNTKVTQKQITAKIKADIKQLKSFGFIEARQYIKDNKLKLKTEVRVKTERDDTKTWIKLHNSGFEQHCRTIDLNTAKFDQEFKEGTVKVDVFDNFKDIISNFSRFYIVKDDPKVKAFDKIRSPDQIHEQIKDKKFVTNHGNLTVDEILKHSKLNKERIEIQRNVEENEFNLINRVPKKIKRMKLLFIVGSIEGKPLPSILKTERRNRNSPARRKGRDRSREIEDSLGRLSIVLMQELRQPRFDPNNDLDDYYQKSLEKLNETLVKEKLIGYDLEQVDTYYSDNSKDNSKYDRITRDQFNETQDYEDYLLKLEQIHKQVKNQTLRKLFGDHHQGTWKQKYEQVLTIHNQLRGKKK